MDVTLGEEGWALSLVELRSLGSIRLGITSTKSETNLGKSSKPLNLPIVCMWTKVA